MGDAAPYCSGCGAPFDDAASFCRSCGAARTGDPGVTRSPPAPAEPPRPPDEPVGGRGRLASALAWFTVGVAVVALAVGGFVVASWLLDGDDAAAPGTSTGATSDPAAQPPPTGAGDALAPACLTAVADAVAAVEAARANAASGGVAALAEAYRSGPGGPADLASSAAAFETAITAAAAAGCDPARTQEQFESAAGEADGAERLLTIAGFGAASTGLPQWGLPALAFYPIPVPTDIPAIPAAEPEWTVILESLDVAEYTQGDASVFAARYEARGIPTRIFLSTDYASLNAGYWVVASGSWDRRAPAQSYCSSIVSSEVACYDRFVQDLPESDAAAFALCGAYGRYRVAGLASGATLDVRGSPGTASPVISSLPAGATGVQAVGLVERSSATNWVPVASGGRIGWVNAAFLVQEPGCAGEGTPTDCAAAEDEALALAQHVLNALGQVEVGAEPGEDVTVALEAAEQRMGVLSVAADELGCAPGLLGERVRRDAASLAASGQVAATVRTAMELHGVYGG